MTVECDLPVSTVAASTQYRSVNDPSNRVFRKFLLVDTPGHGKLRRHAMTSIVSPNNVKGIIFVVDAATVAPDNGESVDDSLTETAQYLHDVLLVLQKKHTASKTSKGPAEMPVLIAANKLDLFTALPAKLVRRALEDEITKLRNTRSKGLLDSGIGMSDEIDEERDILGGGGEGRFEFGLMEEYNVRVEVIGGNVLGSDSADVANWWDWLGRHL